MKISIYQNDEMRSEKIALIQDDENSFIKAIHTPDTLVNDIVIKNKADAEDLFNRKAWNKVHTFFI